MPTTYTDQFFLIDPFSPPLAGTALNFVNYTLTDVNDDGDIDVADGDTVNGLAVSSAYPGDTITINVAGVGNVTYTGITFYLPGGGRAFTPTDGQVLQNGTLVSTTWVAPQGPLLVGDLGPPCFAAGTLIETADGPRPIEDIAEGDLVLTLDDGLQPVRWAGSRTVAGIGALAPIRFEAGAVGNARPLLVSPQHKMLIGGWRAELLFGCEELLVAATHLVNGDTITRVPCRSVTYHHLMLDAHQVLFAEGAPAESFYPGRHVLQDDDLKAEITAIFPEMLENPVQWEMVRPAIKGCEARVLNTNLGLAA